jgi:hypothetical protein
MTKQTEIQPCITQPRWHESTLTFFDLILIVISCSVVFYVFQTFLLIEFANIIDGSDIEFCRVGE